MEEFEKAVFAGLGPDQCDILWSQHQHIERRQRRIVFCDANDRSNNCQVVKYRVAKLAKVFQSPEKYVEL